MFKYLKEAGYYNVWMGKNDMLSKEAVEKYVDVACFPKGVVPPNPYDIDDPHYYTQYRGKWNETGETHSDNIIIENACRFLRSKHDKPFCLFLALSFVHPPYFVEEPYFSMYSPDDTGYIPQAEHAGKASFMKHFHRYSGMDRANEDHAKKIKAAYYGMITKTDNLFGKLAKTLEDTSLMNESALFFMADHGNYAGDFGLPSKWWTGCEDSLLNVPLAVRLPGHYKRGISDAMVQNIDIFATIMNIAGIEPEAKHFGRSLLSLMKGEKEEIRDCVFAESGYNSEIEISFDLEREKFRQQPKQSDYYYWKQLFEEQPETVGLAVMIRTKEWKYVWRQLESDELYNMKEDPYEQNNLLYDSGEKYESIRRELKERMFEWMMSTSNAMLPGNDGYRFDDCTYDK